MRTIGSVVVAIWFIIGIFVAYQRGYFEEIPPSCPAAFSGIATIALGPLNYIPGVDPIVRCSEFDVLEPAA